MADISSNILIWGVGVGPGDPELLTLKGLKIIGECQVVAYPVDEQAKSYACQTVRSYLNPISLHYPFSLPLQLPMDERQKHYRKIAEAIGKYADEGKKIALLCEGDPLLYGSSQYILSELSDKYRVGVIPGISSITAAAAAAHIPLLSGQESLVVIPATIDEGEMTRQLQFCHTAVILKVGRHVQKVKKVLSTFPGYQQALLMENIGHPNEYSRLLHQADDRVPSYFSLVLWRRLLS